MRHILFLFIITCALYAGCKKKTFIEPLSPIDSSGIELPKDTALFHDTVRLSLAPGFEEILIFKKIIPDTKKDGFVRYGDIKDIDSLDVSAMFFEGRDRFVSIKGIEYFTKLRYLNMSDSFVKTVDLSKNIKLEYLDCSGTADEPGWNQTIKVLDVTKCKGLRYLDCSTNLLTALDISQNLKLVELFCYANFLKRIDISNNRLLRTLDVSVNREMKEIYLTNSPEIENLYLNHNKFHFIDVSALKKLKIFSCSGNRPDSLFKTVDISHNSQLAILDISSTTITKIDLSKNPKIEYLICNVTKIKSINLSKLQKLKGFDCAYSDLSSLDISANSDLEYLEIGGTKIRELNLNKNRNLKYFVCLYQDYIADLNFTNCKNIQVCQTYGCPNLKTICVDKIPDPADEKWKTNEWTKYITCK